MLSLIARRVEAGSVARTGAGRALSDPAIQWLPVPTRQGSFVSLGCGIVPQFFQHGSPTGQPGHRIRAILLVLAVELLPDHMRGRLQQGQAKISGAHFLPDTAIFTT